ncbi:MAG TPA: hypothetical protein VFV18_05245 [Porticoccaceae bacterium]|nr:hypothetical protein [Porticoccaceae bacterium]
MNQEQRYDLLFRGDIVPGRLLDEVKARVRELFQIDDARLAGLFSGRPVLIRRDLGTAEAERYREVLANAGALVEVRPAAAAPVGASSPAAPAAPGAPESVPPAVAVVASSGGDADAWTLTAAGADLLRPEERRAHPELAVDLSHLSVQPPGADVLRPEERRVVAPANIDTSRLDLQPLDD